MSDRWTQTLKADAVVWDRMWELDLCKDHDNAIFLQSALIVVAAGITVIAAPSLTGGSPQDPPLGQRYAAAAKRVVAFIRVTEETYFFIEFHGEDVCTGGLETAHLLTHPPPPNKKNKSSSLPLPYLPFAMSM